MLSSVEPPSLTPLARAEPIGERVYRELRAALLHGTIAPGERLVEADLAGRLGVSRTPVREALARLVAEGMVTVRGSGLVARDAAGEMADIYGLRQVLEGYAARLAAQRATPEELDRLSALSSQLRTAIDQDDLDQHVELNNAFHLAVAEASRNDRLIKLISDYRAYFLNREALRRYDRATMLRSQEQHEAIVTALRAGVGDAAEQLVRAHFQEAMARLLDEPPA